MNQIDQNNKNNQNNQQDSKISLLDINAIRESAKVIQNSLDKGCKGGQYNLNEAFLLKISCDNIGTAIDKLEQLQNIIIDLVNKRDNSQQNISTILDERNAVPESTSGKKKK